MPPDGADRVVELLEPADGARHRDHMGAGAGERERGRCADTARGAGDEGDAVGEGWAPGRVHVGPLAWPHDAHLARRHGQLASASSDNCRGEGASPERSVSGVG